MLYILHILSTKYGKNRDDGLACFENVNGPQADRIRKYFIYIFRKEFQQRIVCETNLKIAFDNSKDLYNMHFIPVALKIRSNSIQILTRISIEVKTGKDKSYGSVLHIVALFPQTLVKAFHINFVKYLIRTM